MKKVKGFNVDDKVFAKVKGYPAWPAIITQSHNTRYSVKFYGTGETGSVKPKDLFYYVKHKNIFLKSLKRKDYIEAIEEIEQAIKESGTDGNTEEDATLASTLPSSTSINDSVDSGNSKSRKRKISSSISSEKLNDVKNKKKVISRSTTPANSNVQDSKIEDEDVTRQTNQNVIFENSSSNTNAVDSSEIIETPKLSNNDENEDAATDTSTNLQDITESETSEVDTEQDKKNEVTPKSADNDGVSLLTAADVKIVTDDYLQALITYAGHVKKNEEMYRKKPVEERSRSENEIVIAKLPEGGYVGIKYNREEPPPMKSEYEYAEYDESEAKTILSLKTVVQQGSCKPEDDPNLFVTNLDIDDVQLHDAIQLDLINRKRLKLNWLRIESNLILLDTKIKACLGLDKANPEAALEHLDTMLKLEIDPLMLKKHPHVVDMIKRLRRYIGNVKEWNMSDDERAHFEADAEKVKDIANDVYMKFAKQFGIDDSTMFWDVFVEEVEEFKHQVKDLQEAEVFALSAEPNSRRAFLDEPDQREEMQLIENMEKAVKAETENSGEMDDTDDNQGSDSESKF